MSYTSIFELLKWLNLVLPAQGEWREVPGGCIIDRIARVTGATPSLVSLGSPLKGGTRP